MGVGGEEFDMYKFDAAFAAIEELRVFAAVGVEICWRIFQRAFDAARLRQFEELTHVGLNYAFDTGHAQMGEGVETAFTS